LNLFAVTPVSLIKYSSKPFTPIVSFIGSYIIASYLSGKTTAAHVSSCFGCFLKIKPLLTFLNTKISKDIKSPKQLFKLNQRGTLTLGKGCIAVLCKLCKMDKETKKPGQDGSVDTLQVDYEIYSEELTKLHAIVSEGLSGTVVDMNEARKKAFKQQHCIQYFVII
jgi:hypothetical protein